MPLSFTGRKRIRKNYGRIPTVTSMPNLIEVQRNSYEQFLQMHVPGDRREDGGLQAVFKSVFPISDFSESALLEFVKYQFEAPKYDVEECQQRGLTYAAPLKVTLRLIVFEVDRRYLPSKTNRRSRPPPTPPRRSVPLGVCSLVSAAWPQSGACRWE